jgi:hypothetical protein
MATSDLLGELQKDTFRTDADMERKLCGVVLNQLEDPSGDISNLAVSWCVTAPCMRKPPPVPLRLNQSACLPP